MTEDNFLEIENLEEANKINLEKYSFNKYSDTRGYIFVKRRKK